MYYSLHVTAVYSIMDTLIEILIFNNSSQKCLIIHFISIKERQKEFYIHFSYFNSGSFIYILQFFK